MRTDDRTPEDTPYDPSMVDIFGNVREGFSLSGHERNVFFLSREGQQFDNLSGISGADDPADGRAVGLLDYDRDGWQDLVVVNANAPQVQLFRNQIGSTRNASGEAGFIAVKLVGGNHTASPAPGLSNRDGIGARIEVVLPDATLIREMRAGEGFAAQNSTTLLIGVGDVESVQQLRVRWPSGKVHETGPLPVGRRITVHEVAESEAERFVVEPYQKEGLAARASRNTPERVPGRQLAASTATGNDAPLHLLKTTATWCPRCRGELPQVAILREAFDPKQVALFAVPIDEHDDAAKLEAYVKKHKPEYEMLTLLSRDQIDAVQDTVIDELRIDALPAVVATDAEGHVIRTFWGVPSISDVRELLREMKR